MNNNNVKTQQSTRPAKRPWPDCSILPLFRITWFECGTSTPMSEITVTHEGACVSVDLALCLYGFCLVQVWLLSRACVDCILHVWTLSCACLGFVLCMRGSSPVHVWIVLCMFGSYLCMGWSCPMHVWIVLYMSGPYSVLVWILSCAFVDLTLSMCGSYLVNIRITYVSL